MHIIHKPSACVLVAGLVWALMAPGCSEPEVETVAQTGAGDTPAPAGPTVDQVREAIEDELALPHGDGRDSATALTTLGDACRGACAAGYTTFCLRVTGLCAVADTVTIGSVTVPCATAIAAACIGGATLAAVCGGRCPP